MYKSMGCAPSAFVKQKWDTASERDGKRGEGNTEVQKVTGVETNTVEVAFVDVRLNGEMRGMTVLDDELFVVECKDLAVKVYDAHTILYKRSIDIPGMLSAHGIASCSFNKFLYVSDWPQETIHRVNLTDNSVKRWRLTRRYEPYGLSMTSEHNVLVTVRNSFMRGCGIVEYTSEGQLIRDIHVQLDIRAIDSDSGIHTRAWQAVQLSNDQYIIGHGWWWNCNYALSLINSEGQVIKNYSKEAVNGYQFEPHTVTIDRSTDRVFAAGKIFSKDLTHIGYCGAVRYNYFDPKSDLLFVGCSYTQRGGLTGLTVVGDRTYVVNEHLSSVHVYDSHTLVEQPSLYIPGLWGPRSVAGCSYNNALYICNTPDESVYRINLIDKSSVNWKLEEKHALKRWLLTDKNASESWRFEEKHYPLGVSVTPEYDVLVLVEVVITRKNSKWEIGEKEISYRVLKYTGEGQLLVDLELSSSIKDAWQAVQLSSDKFIFCQGRDKSDSLSRLCVINSKGQIIKSYGNHSGRGEHQLNSPRSFTIDYNSGHLFLADYYNRRILMFNNDLTLLGQVQTPPDITHPTSVHYDSSSDRLIVGESYTNRVAIICSPHKCLNSMLRCVDITSCHLIKS